MLQEYLVYILSIDHIWKYLLLTIFQAVFVEGMLPLPGWRINLLFQ